MTVSYIDDKDAWLLCLSHNNVIMSQPCYPHEFRKWDVEGKTNSGYSSVLMFYKNGVSPIKKSPLPLIGPLLPFILPKLRFIPLCFHPLAAQPNFTLSK